MPSAPWVAPVFESVQILLPGFGIGMLRQRKQRRQRDNEKAAADDARGGRFETDVLCWADQFTTPTFCSATEFLPLAVFVALSAKIVTLRIVPFVTEPISCVALDFSPEAMLRALAA